MMKGKRSAEPSEPLSQDLANYQIHRYKWQDGERSAVS